MLFGSENELQESFAAVQLLCVGFVASLTIAAAWGQFCSEVPRHPFPHIAVPKSTLWPKVRAVEKLRFCDSLEKHINIKKPRKTFWLVITDYIADFFDCCGIPL